MAGDDDGEDWEAVERASGMFGCPPTFRVYAIETSQSQVTRVQAHMAQFPEDRMSDHRKGGAYVILLGQTQRMTEDEAKDLLATVTRMTPNDKRTWARDQRQESIEFS